MDKFESFSETVRSTAETISKKTVDAVDISKYKLNAAEINSEINRRYEALGRIVYDAKTNGYICDDLIEQNIKGLDVLYRRLNEIDEKVAKIKNKVNCKNCGAANVKNAVFCIKCGSRIKEEK